jgi:hypothetical protein
MRSGGWRYGDDRTFFARAADWHNGGANNDGWNHADMNSPFGRTGGYENGAGAYIGDANRTASRPNSPSIA